MYAPVRRTHVYRTRSPLLLPQSIPRIKTTWLIADIYVHIDWGFFFVGLLIDGVIVARDYEEMVRVWS